MKTELLDDVDIMVDQEEYVGNFVLCCYKETLDAFENKFQCKFQFAKIYNFISFLIFCTAVF